MARQEIGDFSGAYPTADFVDARNIRGNVISSQVIELAGQGGVIRTQDFVSGSEGWAIFADGTAEFQDAVLRGTITATGGQITGAMEVTGTLTVGGIHPRLYLGSSGGSRGIFFTNSSGTQISSIYSTASGDLTLHSGTGFIYQSGVSTIDTTIHFFRQAAKFADGSVGTPGIHFENDTDTGIYRAGTNDMRLVAGGSSIAQVTTSTFGPGTDNAYSLGSSGQRWTAVWAVNGTIQTSDMRHKDVHAGDVPGLDFLNKLDVFRYTWKTGNDPKVHWGLSAQQVGSLIGDEGPFRDGDILGLSYAELVPALIVAVQELSARLESYERSTNT